MLLPYYQRHMLVRPRCPLLLPYRMSMSFNPEFWVNRDVEPLGLNWPFKNRQARRVIYRVQLKPYSVYQVFIDIVDGYLVIEADCGTDDGRNLLRRTIRRFELPEDAEHEVMSTHMELSGVLTIAIGMKSTPPLPMLTEGRVMVTEVTEQV